MPTPAIDHVVLVVRELEATARDFTALGFTLTPRAQHPWGTANRLAQFRGGNFLELLEVERPELIPEHDFGADPPRFSFGAFTRDFVRARGEGLSMLVLQGHDSAGDIMRFAAAGLTRYALLDFEREATLPDGARATVAFSLAFAHDPALPRAGFFTCHNRFLESFWRPAFQAHGNGTERIAEVVLVAPEPERHAAFLAGFVGGAVERRADGLVLACGPHRLSVLTPAAHARRFGGETVDLAEGPRLAALVFEGPTSEERLVPASAGHGATLGWRRAR
jgi:hypothetical protein